MTEESDAYEEFVKSLVQSIEGSGRIVSNIQSGRNNTHLGKSGHSHQVDVSFMDETSEIPTLVLVECKSWKENVGNEVVKVLHSTIFDIWSHPETPDDVQGMIVSTKGFASGAKTLAKEWMIDLQVVSEGPSFSFRYKGFAREALESRLILGHKVDNVID